MYPVLLEATTWLTWSICERCESEPNGNRTIGLPMPIALRMAEPKSAKALEAARQAKADRDLDQHRMETGDGR